jgi:hypothetical protein
LSLHSYYNGIVHKQQYRRRCLPCPFLSVPVGAAGPAARICKRCLTLIVSRLTPKDARCRASAFEHKNLRPGSPYAVSVELRITTIFSAWSTSLQGVAHTGRPPLPVQRQLRPIGRTNNIRPQRRRSAPQARPSRPPGRADPIILKVKNVAVYHIHIHS